MNRTKWEKDFKTDTHGCVGQYQNVQFIANGVPEKKEKEMDAENIFEKLMTGNFPNLVTDIHQSQWMSS